MIRTLATTAILALSLSEAAVAAYDPAVVTDPPATLTTQAARPWATRGAAMALRKAYHAIADAQAIGATTYLDAAKAHYRDALARYGKQDPGAAAEAMAAGALARAAVAARPTVVPRDIPPPPDVAAMPPMPQMQQGQQGQGMRRPEPRDGHGPSAFNGFGMHERFDPSRLARDAKLANTPEATDLAQRALEADVARTRASFSGNTDEAMREGRLASDLAMAVRSLARAEHPRS